MGFRGHGMGRDIEALSIGLRGGFLFWTVAVSLLREKPLLGRAGGVSVIDSGTVPCVPP